MTEPPSPPSSHPSDPTCSLLADLSAREPYALKMGLRVLLLEPGRCRVEMRVGADMVNVFGITHGGAVFSVMDEAFQLACNAHGTTAYALNLSVTYVLATGPGDVLIAEANEIASTARTASYDVKVYRANGDVVAAGQALAYRKKTPLPFSAPDRTEKD